MNFRRINKIINEVRSGRWRACKCKNPIPDEIVHHPRWGAPYQRCRKCQGGVLPLKLIS